jgi:tRNA(Ile)-lysidine synthetase-like protein
VRLQLLPRLEHDRPGISRRILSAARRAAELQSELEAQVSALLPRPEPVSLAALTAAPPAVRAEVVRRMYREFTGRSPALSAHHHAAIAALIERGHSGDGLDLPANVRIQRGYQHVEMIGMLHESATPDHRLEQRPCHGCGESGAAHFLPGTDLTLGYRSPGLRMRPLPSGRLRKLQDILVDAKVPRRERDALACVFAGGDLAWVPGVALDARWAAAPGNPSIHAEVVGSRNALLESAQPTQGVLS